MVATAFDPASKARRERDLERMRAKWRRDKVRIHRRPGKKSELLPLEDLARAIRYAKRLTENEALLKHLEIAACYFDDAEGI